VLPFLDFLAEEGKDFGRDAERREPGEVFQRGEMAEEIEDLDSDDFCGGRVAVYKHSVVCFLSGSVLYV
jgi:hypothetical protein